MSVRIEGDVIFLEGECGVEDAEPLVRALEGGGGLRVDVSHGRQLHSAVVQALLRFQPRLDGAPEDGFLIRFVLSALAEACVTTAGSILEAANVMERSE